MFFQWPCATQHVHAYENLDTLREVQHHQSLTRMQMDHKSYQVRLPPQTLIDAHTLSVTQTNRQNMLTMELSDHPCL